MTITGPGDDFLLLLVVRLDGPLTGGSERFQGPALKLKKRKDIRY